MSARADPTAAPAETAIAVVVVTYNCSPHIARTLEEVNRQLRADDELVVVDNASTDGTVAVVAAAGSRARLIENRKNTGFTGGCNLGASATAAPLILFLNPDAVAGDGFLDALRAAAEQRPRWGAWQALVTLPEENTINTCGGVVHYLGLAWAGGCGEAIDRAPVDLVDIGFASGAAMVVRRSAWDTVGGFDDSYFMYGEDVDLSLRLRLAGYGVGIAPRARVAHDYEFDKGARKWFWLERNRWFTVIAVYPRSLLIATLPALLAAEIVLFAVALRGGWSRQKLKADLAVLRALRRTLRRRREVQAGATVSAREFAGALSPALDSPYLGALAQVSGVAACSRLVWRVILAATTTATPRPSAPTAPSERPK